MGIYEEKVWFYNYRDLCCNYFLNCSRHNSYSQRFELLSVQRDQTRKLAINEIYYNLEEVFYKKNGFYPEKLDENAVKGIDPNLLTDPYGILINEEKSDYRYEPTSCENGKCKKFSLRTKLEKESDFVRRSKN